MKTPTTVFFFLLFFTGITHGEIETPKEKALRCLLSEDPLEPGCPLPPMVDGVLIIHKLQNGILLVSDRIYSSEKSYEYLKNLFCNSAEYPNTKLIKLVDQIKQPDKSNEYQHFYCSQPVSAN